MTPPLLERLVKKSLAKEPDERWQTARDLADELRWIAEAGSEASAAAPVGVRGRNRERLAWIVAGLLLLGLVAALLFIFANPRRPTIELSPMRFPIHAAEKQSFLNLSISPDGRRLVYLASTGGNRQLWVRQQDSLTAQPLPGTDNVVPQTLSFWSPDSRSIGFFSDGKLKRMEVSGGPAQEIADAPNARGGTWNREGVIVFSPGGSTPLYRVSATGGETTQLTTLDESRQEITHRWPSFLPDGRHFLYLARSTLRENNAICVGSLDSKEVRRIMAADSNASYAAPGYLLFGRGGALMAQPFDADKLEVTGEAFRVVEQIRYSPTFLLASFSTSSDGVLVYLTGSPLAQLTWYDRGGKPLGTVGPPGEYRLIRLSPDEKRVAVERSDRPAVSFDLWLIDLARGVPSRLTSDPADDLFPVWSPDGSRIAFSTGRGSQFDLYEKLSSGAGGDKELFKSAEGEVTEDWSADGRYILYRSGPSGKTKFDLWVLPLEGDGKPYPLLQTAFNEYWARFSPDGRWMAYVSDDTGKDEVYVREFQGSGARWPVSTGGGSFPRWRGDGKEIFYTLGGKMMAVEVKAVGSGFEAVVPKPLFETVGAGGSSFDVSRDGQRFLVVVPVEESSPTPITVVLNWTADLKR